MPYLNIHNKSPWRFFYENSYVALYVFPRQWHLRFRYYTKAHIINCRCYSYHVLLIQCWVFHLEFYFGWHYSDEDIPRIAPHLPTLERDQTFIHVYLKERKEYLKSRWYRWILPRRQSTRIY